MRSMKRIAAFAAASFAAFALHAQEVVNPPESLVLEGVPPIPA